MAPTVVFALGGWPLIQFSLPLQAAFEAKSYPFVCKVAPSLPKVDPGSEEANPDTEFLRNEVLGPLVHQGKEIVLLMHSYGGIYGASAVQDFSRKERASKNMEGGIVALIFVAAFCAPAGASAMNVMGIDPEHLPDWIYHDKNTGTVKFVKAKEMIFHDLPDEEAQRLADSLPLQAYSSFAAPVRYAPYNDDAYKGRIGYIFTAADRIVPLEAQKIYAETAGAKVTVTMENSSHSPHLEQPKNLADEVIELYKQLAL